MSCVSPSSSSCRAVAFLLQGAANSLVLPVSASTLKHKAWQATCVSSPSVCVRCQSGSAASAKPAPVCRPEISNEGGGGMNTSVLTPFYIDFLQSMSFSNSRDSCYPELLDMVAARLKANGGSGLPEQCIRTCAGFGSLAYSFHPVDLQAKIGHFTALGIMADDLAGTLTGAARERYLEDLRQWSVCVDIRHGVAYKSGLSVVYAYFVIMQTSSSGSASEDEHFFYNRLYPIVPELMDAIDFANDVMSFYKELQQGEDSIAILTQSRIHNLSLLQSLRDKMEAVILSRTRLMSLADRTGSDAITDRIVKFFHGYLSLHIGSKRYSLDEILSGWYKGGFWA